MMMNHHIGRISVVEGVLGKVSDRVLTVAQQHVLQQQQQQQHRRRQVSSRSSSSPSFSSLVTTNTITLRPDLDDDDADNHLITVLRMNRKPVNALSLEMCMELSYSIRKAKESSAAIIISSSISNIFSAGIDIKKELYRPDINRLSQFWFSFQQLFLDLYGVGDDYDDGSIMHGGNNKNDVCTSIIAAVNGHAPAGGCMIASSCDYRIMKNDSTLRIGYNESRLGIATPPWMIQRYVQLLGSHREAESSLLLGRLYAPEDAYGVGLIDELVVDDDYANDEIAEDEIKKNNTYINVINNSDCNYKDDDYDDDDKISRATTKTITLTGTEKAAVLKAKELTRIPKTAIQQIKRWTRKSLVDHLVENRQEDIDNFCNTLTSTEAQVCIESYLHSLHKSYKSKEDVQEKEK